MTDTLLTMTPAQEVHQRILDHTVMGGPTEKIVKIRSGERVTMAVITGDTAVLVFNTKYGLDRMKGDRVVTLHDNGKSWDYMMETFTPKFKQEKNPFAASNLDQVASGSKPAEIMARPEPVQYMLWLDNDLVATFTEEFEEQAIIFAQLTGYTVTRVQGSKKSYWHPETEEYT